MLLPRMRFIKRKRNGEAVTECKRMDLRRDIKVREARGLIDGRNAVFNGDDVIDVWEWLS